MENLPVAAPAASGAPAAAVASKSADTCAESDVSPWVAAFHAAVTQHAKGIKPATHVAAAQDPLTLTDGAAPAAAPAASAAIATDTGDAAITPPWIAALQATRAQHNEGLTAARPGDEDDDEPAGKKTGAADSADKNPVDGAAIAASPTLPATAIVPTPPAIIPPSTPASAPALPATTRVSNAAAATTDATDPRLQPRAQTAGAPVAPKPQPNVMDAAATTDAAARQVESHNLDNVASRDGAGRDAGPSPAVQFAPAPAGSAHTAPAAGASAATQLQINSSVGSAAWGPELGQKIVYMIGEKQHVAELRVNPPDLGPLDIKLTVTDNQTTAVFTSPHGAVRDAVESALPRLREVLAESGIMLGNASVTADTPRDGSAFSTPQDQPQRGNFGAPASVLAPASTAAGTLIRRNGLVDLFA